MAGLFVVVVGFVTVGGFTIGWDFISVSSFEEAVRSWGMWGVVASIGLMIIHSFIPFPAEFLAIANGMVFGPVWGVMITWSGAMLGAFLAFYLARFLGRPFVKAMVVKKNWRTLDNWTEANSIFLLLISRLIPVIAFNLINYAAGLTRVSFWTFSWTTGVGILPMTVLMVVLGDRIHSLDWVFWSLVGGAALLFWFTPRRRLYFNRH